MTFDLLASEKIEIIKMVSFSTASFVSQDHAFDCGPPFKLSEAVPYCCGLTVHQVREPRHMDCATTRWP